MSEVAAGASAVIGFVLAVLMSVWALVAVLLLAVAKGAVDAVAAALRH
jgi:hypothetical protein